MRLIIFAILTCISCGGVIAQVSPKKGIVRGVIVEDGDRGNRIGGATVRLIIGPDTVNSVSQDGLFTFPERPYGKVTLLISHISFEMKVVILAIDKREMWLEIPMKVAPKRIKEIVVNGRVPVMTVRGDTLIYNAAAIKLLEGDHTIDLIKQMPGIVVDDNQVTVLGEKIMRTYVDNKLIFGMDPMSALKNLRANDVIQIKVYDEPANRSTKYKQRKGDRTERVFNIVTKSKLLASTNANFLASYGSDIGKSAQDNKPRYGVGAQVDMFSEDGQVSVDTYLNNINRISNRVDDLLKVVPLTGSYNRNAYVSVVKTWLWKTKTQETNNIFASYSFDGKRQNVQQIAQQVYFPTAEYTSRTYTDTTNSLSTNNEHAVSLIMMLHNVASGRLCFTHIMGLNNSSGSNYSANSTQIDDVNPVGHRSSAKDKERSYNISETISWSINPHKKWSFDLGGGIQYSNGDGNTFRIDTLSSMLTNKVIETSTDDKNREYTAEASVIYKLSDKKVNDLGLLYCYKYSNARNIQMSVNTSDPSNMFIDSVNTYNFTNNNDTYQTRLYWNVHVPKLKGLLSFDAKYNTSIVHRGEQFPEAQKYDKRFNAFLPSISYTSTGMALSSLLMHYMTYVTLPSAEQLIDKIDDINPYMLRAGNSTLKQTYIHHFSVTYTDVFPELSASLRINAFLQYNTNPVALKTVFFKNETKLPGYNGYIALAQSTLSTFENVRSKKNGVISVYYSQLVKFIRSTLNTAMSFRYEDYMNYLGETLNNTKTSNIEAKIGLQSNLSRVIRIEADVISAYTHSANTASNKDKYFTNTIKTTVELQRVLKRLYVRTNYNAVFYNSLNKSFPNTTNHVLNVMVGCKVMKRNGDISISVHDILNRNTGFKSVMMSNYVRNEWNAVSGRYIALNVGYYFNRTE